MAVESVRVSRQWLALREPADAAARARELVDELADRLAPTGPHVIHDLGGGTGAMGRWLAPLLPGPQHWVVHDRDAELLAVAAAESPARTADQTAVTVETRRSDITRLNRDALADATLITASALLDMLTGNELDAILGSCTQAGCPILLSLSVVGDVTLTPADRLDERVTAAFNDHQRRVTERGRLLGPDAVAFAAERLRRRGHEVLVRPSPWRLGAPAAKPTEASQAAKPTEASPAAKPAEAPQAAKPTQAPPAAELAQVWLTGWVAAAREQRPELKAALDPYEHARLQQLRAGELSVTVGHADLLALPPDR